MSAGGCVLCWSKVIWFRARSRASNLFFSVSANKQLKRDVITPNTLAAHERRVSCQTPARLLNACVSRRSTSVAGHHFHSRDGGRGQYFLHRKVGRAENGIYTHWPFLCTAIMIRSSYTVCIHIVQALPFECHNEIMTQDAVHSFNDAWDTQIIRFY